MKHSFLKKLTALLLGTIMVFSLIPAIAISTKAEAGDTYELVTNADDLAIGDKIIIVAKDANYALSTEQKSNNRAQTAITKSDDKIVVTADVQELTLEAGTTGGTFAFNTGKGYLYAASSSSNYLRTETTLSANSSWNITIATNGEATIKANGTNTRNLLKYNSGSKLFSCYASGQAAVCIYKLQEGSTECDHIDENDDCKCDNGCGYEFEHEFVNVGDPVAPTCTEAGYQLQECKCGEENRVEGEPATGHNFVGNVCSVCGASGQVYKKVTVAPTDWSGTYLIVYETGNVAFNGALSKLDAVSDTFAVTIVDETIVGNHTAGAFTIEAVNGGYAIKSASGIYIGRSKAENGMEESTSDKYPNTLSIDANGNAVIQGSGGYVLQFNADKGQERFRYYSGKQKTIALYKLVEDPKFESFGVTINNGVTIRVNLTFDPTWIAQNPDARIMFSDALGTQLVPKAGTNPYTITLTPGEIGRDIKVSVSGTSINETVSFAAYKERIEAIDDHTKLGYANAEQLNALKTLLAAIETYGDVAAGTGTASATFSGDVIVPDYKDDISILGGNLALGVNLKDFVNIGITVYPAANLSYKIYLAGKVVASGNDLSSIVADNKLTIENLRPAHFNDEIVLTVTNADDQTTTVTFNFNGYLKGLSEKDGYSDIAAAAYNYGLAVEAYLAVQ